MCSSDLRSHKKMVTMCAYNAGQRFGILDINEDGQIVDFREKAKGDGNLINIGYMVCQYEFINYIQGDSTILEKTPLETVAKLGQLRQQPQRLKRYKPLQML